MIIDCNMHWLPPELLTNDELMEEYLNQVPRVYGDIAYTRMIPGTDIKEVVIEKPAGCINLNFGPETIDPEDRIKVMSERTPGIYSRSVNRWFLFMVRKLKDSLGRSVNAA